MKPSRISYWRHLNFVIHLHAKAEGATFIDAWRVDPNDPTTTLNYLLDHGKTQADALAIDLRRPLQLAEASKEFGEVHGFDSHPSVLHVHYKETAIVAYTDGHCVVAFGKFERIFYQVHHHLSETALVTIHVWQWAARFACGNLEEI